MHLVHVKQLILVISVIFVIEFDKIPWNISHLLIINVLVSARMVISE